MKHRRAIQAAIWLVSSFSLLVARQAFAQQGGLAGSQHGHIRSPALSIGNVLPPDPEVRQQGGESSKTIALKDLISEARAENPEIRAAEQRYHAAQARPLQAGALADPWVEASYHNEKIGPVTLGESDFSFLRFGASQEIPFPGKRGLRERISAREAEREEQALHATILSVTSRLSVAYADDAFTYQALKILERNKQFLLDLQKSAEARYQVGQGIQQDPIKAQVEVSLLTSRVIQLERKKAGLEATINALLNRPPLQHLGIPAPLKKPSFTTSLEQIKDIALDNSPELKSASIGVKRNELGLSLAHKEYYPDFVMRVDYFNKARLEQEWEVGVGIKVPLYFWRKQRFGVREAAESLGDAMSTRQNVIETLLAQVKDLYVQVSTAGQQATLYETTIIPQSRLSLDSASAGYTVGTVDFLTILNNILVLREAELSYQEQLAELVKSLAQLEAMVGAPLAGK